MDTWRVILGASNRAQNQSKNRDDIWAEISWTLFWLHVQYHPDIPDPLMQLVGERDRVPLNCLLRRAYAEKVI